MMFVTSLLLDCCRCIYDRRLLVSEAGSPHESRGAALATIVDNHLRAFSG